MFECFYKGKVKDINAYQDQEKLKHENLHATTVWETFNVFRLLKCFTTIWESSNILKLYSIQVCFCQTCKFVILCKNISKNKPKTIFLKTIILKR